VTTRAGILGQSDRLGRAGGATAGNHRFAPGLLQRNLEQAPLLFARQIAKLPGGAAGDDTVDLGQAVANQLPESSFI
jgi:hypothetical protein